MEAPPPACALYLSPRRPPARAGSFNDHKPVVQWFVAVRNRHTSDFPVTRLGDKRKRLERTICRVRV